MAATTSTGPAGTGYERVFIPPWLLESDLSLGAKFVYALLATCCRGQDIAWPTQEYLATRASSSVRTVQRAIKELVGRGLIAKGRGVIKGKERQFYRFLVVEPGATVGPVATECRPGKATECRVTGDNLSPAPLHGFESDGGKENAPQPPAEPGPPEGGEERGAGGEKMAAEETEPPDLPLWAQAKESLREKMSEGNFKTWVAPLAFELVEDVAVLKGPNQFFANWVRKNFDQEITAALARAGISRHRYEVDPRLQTPTQAKPPEKGRPAPPPPPSVDSLPLAKQFEALYQVFPRHEQHERAWQAFRGLHGTQALPPTSALVAAVKRAKFNSESWQRENGRYVPRLHKWLEDKRWED